MIAPQVMNLMRIARARGMGGDDSSSVIRVYEQALGREVRAIRLTEVLSAPRISASRMQKINNARLCGSDDFGNIAHTCML